MVSTFRRALGIGFLLGLGLGFACTPSPPAAAPSAPATDSEARAEAQAQAGLEVLEGAPTQEEAPAAPEEGPAAPVSPGGSDDGLDADIAALSESTKPVGEAPATTEPVGREVVYRVTAKGLVIEIDGIHLRPEAKPFKYESGAYGIDLVLNAESFDGRQYWVSQPKEGPLSIAGKVEVKGGKSSRFVDEREAGAEQAVMNGEPRRFKQRWPGRGQPKLWSGQTVTLEVGLWGIRADSERERPVRRLFVVKMVAGNKSPAVIMPPTMNWGT